MNLVLEKLLQNDLLSDKDKYEIRNIFEIVNEEKKQNILRNFDKMLISIVKIKEEIRDSQKILIGKAVSNIEKAIKLSRNNRIKNTTTKEIKNFKKTI